jgi:hypothetical protein
MPLTFIPLAAALARHAHVRWVQSDLRAWCCATAQPKCKPATKPAPVPACAAQAARVERRAQPPLPKPLRVLHLTDSVGGAGGTRRAGLAAGRVLMSGRMADICAELERMALMEERLSAC